MNRTSVDAASQAGNDHAPRILIVDNDDRIVELVSWFLSKKGFVVSSAGSFAETRERLAEGRPDLMLSDVDLGSESALEELPRLDQDGLLPPTLVVSGYLDPATAGSLEKLGPVLGTLAKPFDFPQLEERIETCLRGLDGSAAGPSLTPQAAPPVGVPAAQLQVAAPAGEAEWVEILPAGS